MTLIKYQGAGSIQEYPYTGVNAMWQPNQVSDIQDTSRITKLLNAGAGFSQPDIGGIEAFNSYASLPSPSAFGVGVAQVKGILYACDGVSFTPILTQYKTDFPAFGSNQFATAILPNFTVKAQYEIYPKSPYSSVGTEINLHASIKTNGGVFGGYRYWMAFTPYNNVDSTYENPCINASNDLLNWVAPITNPLIAKPANGYNADTSLCFSPDGLTLYMVYRERITGGNNSVKITKTIDGTSWTTPIVIKAGTAGTKDYACPSLVWNSLTNKYELYTHDLDNASKPIEKCVSSTTDPMGAWGAPVTVNLTVTGGKLWWHSEFIKDKTGNLTYCIIQETTVAGNEGQTYFAYSMNGVDFIRLTNKYFLDSYRPGLFLDAYGNPIVIISNINKATLQLIRLAGVDELAYEQGKLAKYLAGTELPLILDTFTRADSASSIGTSTTGIAWTTLSGTAGITSNKAYAVASGVKSVIDAGVTDCYMQVKITQLSDGENWFVLRLSDANNFIRAGIVGGSFKVQDVISGGVTSDRTVRSASSYSVNSTLGFLIEGTSLNVYIDNNFFCRVTDLSTALTGTNYGFQETHTTTAINFDDLVICKKIV